MGQDVHFSQFYECSALRNPALTGIFSGDYKVFADYRSQWGNFVVPYKTALVTGETKILVNEDTRDYLSFGLTTVYDRAGSIDLTGLSFYGAVNYNKSLGRETPTYLSLGMSGGYLQRSFDISKMQFASQFNSNGFNANNPSGEQMNWGVIKHWDVSTGISLSGTVARRANYYIGAAAFHVTKPKESYFDESLIRLTTRWVGSAGVSANVGKGFGLVVHANYQYQQPYKETIAGFLVSHSFKNPDNNQKAIFAAGLFYRWNDAYIPTMKLEYDAWTLTVSYDMTIAAKRLYLKGYGGYEVSLSMRGNYNHKKSPELKCPHFELDSSELLEVDPQFK